MKLYQPGNARVDYKSVFSFHDVSVLVVHPFSTTCSFTVLGTFGLPKVFVTNVNSIDYELFRCQACFQKGHCDGIWLFAG